MRRFFALDAELLPLEGVEGSWSGWFGRFRNCNIPTFEGVTRRENAALLSRRNDTPALPK
jgi:hypothetical protein